MARVYATVLLGTSPSLAAGPCPEGPLLPAYAHNDYENARPLFDALDRGYRGAEVDIFLVDGELRAAHDRKHTRPGRTLQALYLDPLRDLIERCGRVCPDSTAFLLNVEIKEASAATYDSVCSLVRRYPQLRGHVDVVLVGWHPPLVALPPFLRAQFQVERCTTAPEASPAVRLVSLNYGKTIRWSGRRPVPARARAWFDALQRADDAGPGRIVRAYNVPPRAAIYRLLFESGVDLIGTEDLEATEALLRKAPGRAESGE